MTSKEALSILEHDLKINNIFEAAFLEVIIKIIKKDLEVLDIIKNKEVNFVWRCVGGVYFESDLGLTDEDIKTLKEWLNNDLYFK